MDETLQLAHWVAGFADGEGCFTIGWGGQLVFQIKQRDDQREALELVREVMGVGEIFSSKVKQFELAGGRMTKMNPKLVLRTRNPEAMTVVEFFEAYPLHTLKARDFEIWAAAARSGLRGKALSDAYRGALCDVRRYQSA